MSDLYSGEHQNSVTLNPMLAALGSDSKTTHSASTASAPDGPLNEPTLSPDGTVRNPMTQDLDYDYDHVLAAPPALPLAATESNAEGMLVAALIGHTDGVTCLASSKDNKHLLLSGTLSGEVRQWNVAKKESIKTIPAAHKKRVNGITLGSDGLSFFSAGDDRMIRQWALPEEEEESEEQTENDAKPLREWKVKGKLGCIDQAPMGSYLVTGGAAVSVWDSQSRRIRL